MMVWPMVPILAVTIGWPASGNMPRHSNPEYDDLWLEASSTPSTADNYLELVQTLQDLLITYTFFV